MWSNGNMYITFLSAILTSLVLQAVSQDSRNHYDCNTYCPLNCNDIIDEEHKVECREVHSHHSSCNCHFGGTSFGLFVALGLAAVLILTCCVCRHCKKDEGPRTTNIVVVAEPQTVTTISHQGRNINHTNYSDRQQQVYTIEMKPQSNSTVSSKIETQPPAYSDLDDGASSVTIITSSRMLEAHSESNLKRQQKFSSVSSDRVYFQIEESENNSMDDSVFSPPRY